MRRLNPGHVPPEILRNGRAHAGPSGPGVETKKGVPWRVVTTRKTRNQSEKRTQPNQILRH